MYIICNSQSINQPTIQYLASQISQQLTIQTFSQSISQSDSQSINQSTISTVVDPEMSAVLGSYASHQALLFSLASNHFFI